MADSTLYMLVEGQTEKAIMEDFLRPYWEKRFNKCYISNLKGGGNVKASYPNQTKIALSKPDQAVLILIDLKNNPFGIITSASTNAEDYEQIRKIMYASLGMEESARLGIFPVVVEPETWLLADPTIQNKYQLKPAVYAYPENQDDADATVKQYIRYYNKGESAKKYFEQANAVDVYEDNCPHFCKLVDWLQFGTSPTDPPDAENQQQQSVDAAKNYQTQVLQAKYEDLTQRFEKNLKRGQTAAAGILLTERNFVEQQINELWVQD